MYSVKLRGSSNLIFAAADENCYPYFRVSLVSHPAHLKSTTTGPFATGPYSMDIWERIWSSVSSDFQDAFEVARLTHVAVRLVMAALLGGLLGLERQLAGKPAGLRTHMLVCVGAALFVLVPQLEGMQSADLSRVIQGIVTGIGFLGAGTIIKDTGGMHVQGLTTAAGIWLTSAIGISVGMGRVSTALFGALLAFVILSLLGRVEALVGSEESHRKR
jgi:putative Mg2+ transporter-C (MgtC) family protein